MVKVKKVESEELGAGFGIPEEQEEVAAETSTLESRIEELERRLLSLRGPLTTIEERFRNCDSRIADLSTAIARLEQLVPNTNLDVPSTEEVHPTLYGGLTTKDVFLAALQAAIQSATTRNPTAFDGSRPDLRKSAMKVAVAVAREAADVVAEKCPHIKDV